MPFRVSALKRALFGDLIEEVDKWQVHAIDSNLVSSSF